MIPEFHTRMVPPMPLSDSVVQASEIMAPALAWCVGAYIRATAQNLWMGRPQAGNVPVDFWPDWRWIFVNGGTQEPLRYL